MKNPGRTSKAGLPLTKRANLWYWSASGTSIKVIAIRLFPPFLSTPANTLKERLAYPLSSFIKGHKNKMNHFSLDELQAIINASRASSIYRAEKKAQNWNAVE